MQPKEKRPVRVLLQPLQCPRHALSSATFNQTKIAILELLWRKRVIVKIEAPSQPPTPIQQKRTHHRSGAIPWNFDHVTNGGNLGDDGRPGKCLHTLVIRLPPDQYHRY